MDALFEFAGNYWWLVFVFGGSIAGAVKGVGAANERRAERRLERYRIKQQSKVAALELTKKTSADKDTQRRGIDKTLAEHDDVNMRWFAYETDVINLLEYPMMTNMRDPMTVAFHRAKLEADSLRPNAANDLVGDIDAQNSYRAAVHDYSVAFAAAESEAKRRRRGDFSEPEQNRLNRAQSLLRMAMDGGATPAERQAAYRKARSELEGLVTLPTTAYAQIEQRIAGALEA
ncbi:hypothetical protein GCM10007304_09240 [Rhodococcoides trifolii]|uniref:Uncharacterized protein n=1 Tax=Rhodococcoides trifolii TaxID=908250 RepID=A0A917FRB9_9NOCA|nr:hypothetical protein [Rhodococcus trifolii]GGF97413.1 hypothetical protein GCM10007304_09240 [Rhodococcus trifolii]